VTCVVIQKTNIILSHILRLKHNIC